MSASAPQIPLGTDSDPALSAYVDQRIAELGLTRDLLRSEFRTPVWWLCQHGFVSSSNQRCRFGCDAHSDKTVIFWRAVWNNAVELPSKNVKARYPEPHAGHGEFTPRGDISQLQTVVAAHARRLAVAPSYNDPQWLCRHGFVDCWQPRCSRGCVAANQEYIAILRHSGTVAVHPGRSIQASEMFKPEREFTTDEEIDMDVIAALIAVWRADVGV
jgi:hypothetical protein